MRVVFLILFVFICGNDALSPVLVDHHHASSTSELEPAADPTEAATQATDAPVATRRPLKPPSKIAHEETADAHIPTMPAEESPKSATSPAAQLKRAEKLRDDAQRLHEKSMRNATREGDAREGDVVTVPADAVNAIKFAMFAVLFLCVGCSVCLWQDLTGGDSKGDIGARTPDGGGLMQGYGKFDASLFGCCSGNRKATACLACCCPGLLLSANAKRSGFMGFFKALMLFCTLLIVYEVCGAFVESVVPADCAKDRECKEIYQWAQALLGLLGFAAMVTYIYFATNLRGHIRSKYKINGSSCGDCLLHTFCSCCALAQETDHLLGLKGVETLLEDDRGEIGEEVVVAVAIKDQ